jgi:hypothetical protein
MSNQDQSNEIQATEGMAISLRNEINNFIEALAHSNQNSKPSSENDKIGEFNLYSIPFLPIKLSLKEINHIWPILGDLFFNLEGGILVFLTDAHLVPEETYFIKLAENGNVLQIQEIELNNIPVQIQGNINMEDQFDRLKSWIKAQYNAELGNLLLISNPLIDDLLSLFQNSTQNIESLDLFTLLSSYIEKILAAQTKKNLVMFPTPKIINFLNSFSKLFNNIPQQEILEIIKHSIPELQASLSFEVGDLYCPFKIAIKNGNLTFNRIEFNNTPLQNLDPDKCRKVWLKSIKNQEKLSHNLVVNLQALHQFLVDMFDSEFPLSSNRSKLLLQKFIFGYKSRGILWDLDPWPLIYYPAMRFMAYTLGYRLNLNKISHWSIPETLELFSSKVFGLNSKIGLIIVENLEFLTNNQSSQTMLHQFYSITIENRAITAIEKLPLEPLTNFFENWEQTLALQISSENQQSKKKKIITPAATIKQQLENFRLTLCQNQSYFNSVILVTNDFIRNVLQVLNSELLSRQFPPVLKSKKIIQQKLHEGGLCIVPQSKYFDQPEFHQVNEITKILLSMITDHREF